MNEWDGPGAGWREVTGEVDATHWSRQDHVSLLTAGSWRHWVPEEPVPPLPTEANTVIRVTWRDTGVKERLILDEDGHWWGFLTGDDLLPRITGFEVLAEPRRVDVRTILDGTAPEVVRRETAKAVLDRVRDEGILRNANAHDVADEIAREFGLSS